MDFLTQLQSDRDIDVKFWKKHPELRKQLVDDAYSEKAHFIYELLQNAEDAFASTVTFHLHKDRLEVRHNGKRTFTESDITAITDVSKSGKPDTGETIGKFGIGFKSVFKYTDSPKIYSGQYAFAILDFVYPESIPMCDGLEMDTLFVLPFGNARKSENEAYEEIRNGLRELAGTTLLFLSNIEAIRWQIDQNLSGEVRRIQHTNNHIEVLRETGDKEDGGRHFLRFSEVVEGKENQRVAVAFELKHLPDVTVFDPQKPLANQCHPISPLSRDRMLG